MGRDDSFYHLVYSSHSLLSGAGDLPSSISVFFPSGTRDEENYTNAFFFFSFFGASFTACVLEK